MARRKSRAQRAARGTAADPNRERAAAPEGAAGAGTPGKGGASGGGKGAGAPGGSARPKLHGVITEAMVPDQLERSGTYPFTFSSSLILFVAAFAGGVLVPALAGELGLDARVATVAGISVLLPLALALTRYFLDSKRGLCRGFWITLGVSFAVCVLVVSLLLFGGILL